MNQQQIVISVVCPFYNEKDMVGVFMDEIFTVLKSIGRTFEIICVNDGSSDNTLEKLLEEQKRRENIKIINLSRNFGKEAALTAGLDFAQGEAVIPIDADLQDPPALIKNFIEYWDKGYDVVLAKRTDRSTDSFGKRITAQLFYKLHNKISSTKIPDNVGDFRLITRKVIKAIRELPENQRFMKGIFAWVGFKTAVVEYKREKRKTGRTSFNGWQLWNFALEGVTSFSTVPLRIWLYLGTFISLSAFCYGSFIVIRTLIFGIDVPGYASLLTTILFLGGIQMIGIGVIGEYIGRMYMESKQRPPYIIDRIF
jgi:glycosyltransferase involved in cell wall biosynthesis